MVDAPTLGVAFVAGIASFFAPCVLPVIPGYLAFVTGGAGAGRVQHLVRTVVFVLGFGIAFVTLGAAIGAVGTTPAFHRAEDWIRRIGGAVIIVFGLHMTGLLRIPFLEREVRIDASRLSDNLPRTVTAGILGAAFAVGWSPCVGPILASILVLAGLDGGLTGGATLLGVYAAGLAVPFLFLGITAERGGAFIRRHKRAAHYTERIGGWILIVLGIFVFTGQLARVLSLIV